MEYDIIITGSGAAGLSMLSHLMNSALRYRPILVIDNLESLNLNKTWCYWDDHPSCNFEPNHLWRKIRISNQQQFLERKIEPLAYFEVRATDFRSSVLKRASQFNNIHFVNDLVLKVDVDNPINQVKGKKANYTGRVLINSIPNLLTNQNLKPTLTQNFKGWRITTPTSSFDPETATLMDFTSASNSEVKFFYVLPFTENQALIEYTRLSSELAPFSHYDQCLKDYIRHKFGITEFSIDYEEFGSIPMTTQLNENNIHEQIFEIGTAGGDTKPTTGYTFKNIQESCRKIIKTLESGKRRQNRFKKKRFRFYDNILLNIIKHEPSTIPSIFFNLFKNNSIHSVLRFLDEKTSLKDEISIFIRLPWAIFLKYIFGARL